ncbi:MAG: MarR family winged helix-turn-helix transcriptional regulator [Paracoccaceae bacterium]
MTTQPSHALAIGLFSEVIAADQAIRSRLSRVLPKGMELSHFSVLNQLARSGGEKTPAQLAHTFGVTRGAMTNTISKLETAGFVHVRPDWDDARRKLVAISPAGKAAWDQALSALAPLISRAVQDLDEEEVRRSLPVLRSLRSGLITED